MSQSGIIWLGEPGSEHPDWVGAKAAMLSRLIGRYPIPLGFCVTASAPSDEGKLPAELEAAVRKAYRELTERCGAPDLPVVVRSSAIDEDGATASFAGIYESYLNVVGSEAVVAAVRLVQASALSERARVYRRNRRQPPDDPRMAVLVQRMIIADASFVAFSMNPLSIGSDDIAINSAWGLGTTIVDGSSTADTHLVRRRDRAVLLQLCGRQTTEVSAVPGGTAISALPPERRGASALGPDEVTAVCEMIVRLENELGFGVDIEGARVGSALHLLQCRPISTLFPVRWEKEEDKLGTWLREDLHFPYVVSPAGGEYARYGMYAGLARLQLEQDWPSRAEARVLNGYVYVNWLYLVTSDKLQARRSTLQAANLQRAHGVLDEWQHAIRPRLDEIYRSIDAMDFSTAAPEAALTLWSWLWALVEETWYLHFKLLYPCMAAARHLQEVCAEHFPDLGPAAALKLAEGRVEQPHRVRQDLHALAQAFYSSSLVSKFQGAAPMEAWSRVAASAGQEPFGAAFLAFLTEHGHLGVNADDLALATWADEPWRIFGELERTLHSPEAPEAQRQRQLAESDALFAELCQRLKDRPQARQHLEEAVALARAVTPLIEDHNYFIDRRLHAKVRRALLRAGARLVASRALASADDVFLLYRDEIAGVLDAPTDCCSLVMQRKQDMRDQQRLRPPSQLTSQPDVDPELPASPLVDVGLLRGTPASAGRGRGRARIIVTGTEIDRVQPGDVLVCHTVNLAWIALFPSLAALVTSTGGMLSHSAIAAREFGLPAVVGLTGATELLADGMFLEVDGTTGAVRISPDESVRLP